MRPSIITPPLMSSSYRYQSKTIAPTPASAKASIDRAISLGADSSRYPQSGTLGCSWPANNGLACLTISHSVHPSPFLD